MIDNEKPPRSELSEASPRALVDVFISYARKDESVAKNLAETLRSEGFEVWFDSSLYAGANWESLLLTDA